MILRGVTVVVLAAGRSHRMGEPKAMVEYGGTSLLQAHLDVATRGHAARCVVVVGEHGSRIRAAHGAPDIDWVINPSPRRGPFSSLVLALTVVRRMPGESTACLLSPVDVPPADDAVLAALRAAAESPEVWAAVPTVRRHRAESERGGHPVWLSAVGVARLLAVPGAPITLRLDHVLASWKLHVRRVPVADVSVLRNLNTPDDLRRV